ncbi:urokinase plasminogen activator surface receptor-like isoform X1 [Alligator mississippiensis]|uniref:urokinase plasminogen activator surface receptor-like isoform X1 n=1 Tax=Alligator mississippiensis TaxID=8496 RepID=UPI0009075498|nr:urokinase plasminogen activator surface receptor-like isoform X1 [Alligator mississippiensis]
MLCTRRAGSRAPPEELLAMAVGPDLVYVHVQCCHGVGCNNGSFVEVPRGKPNGKLCYSCRETGAGECNNEQLRPMTCKGAMDQCLEVQTTDWYHPVTLLRGCTSTDLCRSWELLGRLLLLANTLVHCCSGSLCNRAASCRDPLPLLLLPLVFLLLLAGAWS